MTGSSVRVEPSADVAASAQLGDGTSVWHLAQVREHATLGANCVIGRGAYIGTGVTMGDNCKVQNYALVYEPAVLTNDTYPRAVSVDGSLKSAADWDPVAVTVGDGAAIGARSVCVAPVTVGRWSLVAAGSVVTKDVPDHALVAGVPAAQIGWVGRAGRRLVESADGLWTCPETGERYRETPGGLALEEL